MSTFEKTYESESLREGYKKEIAGVHEILNEIDRAIDDPDTEDWEVEELMNSLKGLNLFNNVAAVGATAFLTESDSYKNHVLKMIREANLGAPTFIQSERFFENLLEQAIELVADGIADDEDAIPCLRSYGCALYLEEKGEDPTLEQEEEIQEVAEKALDAADNMRASDYDDFDDNLNPYGLTPEKVI